MTSTTQLINPNGAVVLFDGETPRTFTGKATETISGGFLVNVSGASGDVGATASTFVTEDLNIIGAQDRTLCNGVALNNAASGAAVTVAQRGAYLGLAASTISAGAEVTHNASGNFIALTQNSSSGTAAVNSTSIGRAMTTASSGTSSYVLVYLNI